MKGVYANVTWYVIMVFVLFRAEYKLHTAPEWDSMPDVRIKYDILLFSLIVLLVIGSLGLLYRKKWAYDIALSANALLTLLPIAALTISILTAFQELGILIILEINSINIIIGVVSLGFWLWLVKSNVRKICNW